MTYEEIAKQIRLKRSFLCIGLDTDKTKIPTCLEREDDPVFSFNKAIIDATHDLCVAYKPNWAFYERDGVQGMISLQKTIEYLKERYPNIFLVADAKRGDIGNTATQYAASLYETFQADGVTVSPYMGNDAVTPFLDFEGKWTIILGLTSNKGAADFQLQVEEDGKPLYERVIDSSKRWGTKENTMYVIGATKSDMLAHVRTLIPHHFLLIPGVGAQGGSLKEVAKYGLNSSCGLLVNSSRGIIYRDTTERFAEVAREASQEIQKEMDSLLKKHLNW